MHVTRSISYAGHTVPDPAIRIFESRGPSLLGISAFFGLAYFLTIAWHPFPGSLILKGLSIATLAVFAWKLNHSLLAIGLGVSSLGDMLLDVQSANLFIPGLIAFLVAHILYAIRFYSQWQRPLRIWEKQRLLIALVLIYAASITLWLKPSLGALTLPVTIYVCAITIMVITAVIARTPWPVLLGALLFLVSDSLLAAGKFKGIFPYRDYLVWGTYFLAQYGIAQSARLENEPAQGW